jgi:hypothetical protein
MGISTNRYSNQASPTLTTRKNSIATAAFFDGQPWLPWPISLMTFAMTTTWTR